MEPKNFTSDLYGSGVILRAWITSEGVRQYLAETAGWGRAFLRESQITITNSPN